MCLPIIIFYVCFLSFFLDPRFSFSLTSRYDELTFKPPPLVSVIMSGTLVSCPRIFGHVSTLKPHLFVIFLSVYTCYIFFNVK